LVSSLHLDITPACLCHQVWRYLLVWHHHLAWCHPVILTAIKFANDSYKDARKIRNLQERAAAFKEIDDKIKEYQRNLYIFTVDAGTDNTVRLPQPKEMFDDMGNIKNII